MNKRQRLGEAPYDEIHPTFKIVADMLPRHLAKAMRDDPSVMYTMVHAGLKRLELRDHRFMWMQDQVEFWAKINRERQWGLDENGLNKALNEAEKSPYSRTDIDLAYTIVPRLPQQDRMPGVKRTFLELWDLAQRNFAATEIAGQYADMGLGTCTDASAPGAPSGEEYRPGFSLEVIRWTMATDKSGSRHVVGEVLNRGNRPVEAGGMACLAVHPEWVRQFSCIQPVYLSGYAARIPQSDGEYLVPAFDYSGGIDTDHLKLDLRRRCALERAEDSAK